MILSNALIRTMDSTMPTTSALAIAGGRVLGGVDSREDVIASHHHERVNLDGATVIPGFVDTHVHFASWAVAHERLALTNITTIDELLAAVEAHAATLAPDAWVLGAGWRDAVVPRDGVQLDAALTQAAGGRPCALTSKDGHALLVTTGALDALGMSADNLTRDHAPDASGAALVGRTAAGDFTGVVRETAAWQIRRAIPNDDITMRTLAAGMREASRRGITTLHDLDGAASFARWQQLEHERGLSLRVWQHLLADDLPHARALGLRAGFGGERLRIGGIKVFADGTLGSGTAHLAVPESSGPGGTPPRHATVLADEASLTELASQAAAAGFPLLIHAIGDAAVSNAVNALAATHAEWRDLGMAPRIEHAQLMTRADMVRCAELGIALAVQPSHLVEDRALVDECWGGDRDGIAYGYHSMVNAGCGLLFGSDAPVEDLAPLAALQAATTRDGGGHLGSAAVHGAAWHPDECLDIETALLASTAWPADAAGVSDEVGRLLPGRRADLVVLSDDPLLAPIESITVLATMVDGRWTYGAAQFG